ncbi:MAG: rhamnosyltransferase subunit, partial [Acidobacteriaceae bacterium]|nr:rhamnosyltransferase subunit [Acidobacteriaceae bacterium]
PSTFLSAKRPPIHKQLRISLFLPYPVRAGLLWAFERGVLDRVCGPDINRLRAEVGLPPFDGSWVGGGNLSLHRFRLEATCMVMGTIVVLFNPSEHQVTNLIRIKQLCAQVVAIDNSPSSDHKQHAQIEAGCRCLRGTPRGEQFWAVA